jgi:NAD(P)-dependent dehydrogenase (short-subunit alcohol dehydrogenase family)
MSNDLKGQVAVVTGGTRGIGAAIARSLLGAGARVAICGRQAAGVGRAVQEMKDLGEVKGRACDVSRYEDVEVFFDFVAKDFGRLDILVNNAGVGVFAPVAEISPAQWREVIETNLNGPFYWCREAVPWMRKSGGGFIVNIGSLAGKNPFAGGSAYNASKFGLNGFSEAIMMDLRYDNIRVSQIMPGSVATEFGRGGEAEAEWKIAAGHIAETVLHLVRMPERSLASRVEMRPSRPPRRG